MARELTAAEEGDLACYFDTKQFDSTRCAAQVRDLTSKHSKSCFIRQCNESIVAHTTIDGKTVGLGKYHASTNKKFFLYRPAKGQSAQKQDSSIIGFDQDIFLALNLEYRTKLKIFINNYENLLSALLQRINELNTKLRGKYTKIDTIYLQIEAKTDKLEKLRVKLDDDELPNNDENIELQRKIELLNQEILTLKKNAVEKEAEIMKLQSSRDNCKLFFEDAASLSRESLHNFAKRFEAEIKSSPVMGSNDKLDRLKQLEIEGEAKQIENRRRKEEKAKQFAETISQREGLYVIIRIRCGQKGNGDSDLLRYDTNLESGYISVQSQPTGPVVKLSAPLNGSRRKDFLIYSDADLQQCIDNKFSQQQETIGDIVGYSSENYENDKRKAYTYFATFWQKYSKVDTAFLNRLKAAEKSHERWMSGEQDYYDEITSRPSYIRGEFDIEIPHATVHAEHEYVTFIRNFPGDERFKMDNIDVYRKITDNMYAYDKKKLASYKKVLETGEAFLTTSSKVLQSGELITTSSALDFVSGQNEKNPLKCVTIIGIGASGSGKTTSAKALLKKILFQYTTLNKFQNFLNEGKITIQCYEVRLDNRTGEIALSELTDTETNARNNKYLKPYLMPIPAGAKRPFGGEPSIYLCGLERSDVCNTNKFKDESGYKMMTKLVKFDASTEKNRDTQYTPDNPNGSSRSVKVLKITLKSKEENVITINLLDPPGYENYDRNDLKEFYVNLVTETRAIDALYRSDDPTAVTSIAEQLTERTSNEEVFIKRTLNYLENSLIKYKELQNNKSINYSKMTEVQQVGTGYKNWIQDLDLMPQHSTVIVLGAFKSKINSKETASNINTLDFLKNITGQNEEMKHN